MDRILEKEAEKILDFLSDYDNIKNQLYVQHISLFSGFTSIMLHMIDCYFQFPTIAKRIKIIEYLKISFDILENQHNVLASYCGGLAGYGFFLSKLKKKEFFSEIEDRQLIEQLEDILLQIDEISDSQIGIYLNEDNFDILHGLTGLGLYFIEREKNVSINRIVDSLYDTCIIKQNQVYWRKYDKYKNHTSVVDMGNAHGNASVIYFLTKLLNKGLHSEKILKMVHGNIAFYIDKRQQQTDTIKTYYAHHIIADDLEKGSVALENSRLAWCYGDLGSLYTLLLAAIELNDHVNRVMITEMLIETSKRRRNNETYTIDNGFCHGSSGISIIFDNLFSLTGENSFKNAAEYWVKDTLESKSPGTGVDGYNFITEGGWQNYGLLEGLSGVLFCYLKSMSYQMAITEETLFLKF